MFDIVGCMTEGHQAHKNQCQLLQKVSPSEQVEEEIQGRLINASSSVKWQ